MFDVEDYLKEKFAREEEQPSSRMVIDKESRTISGKEYNILTARMFEKSKYLTGGGIFVGEEEIDKYGTELDYTWKVIDDHNLGYDGPKEFKGKVIMVPKEGTFESKSLPIVGWAGVRFICETTLKEDGSN